MSNGTKQRWNVWLSQYPCATLQILFISLQFLFVTPLKAHGDIHEQIQKLDQNIKINGPSVSTLLQRAHLHRIHRDWNKALKDLNQAEKLGAHDILLHKARVFIDSKKTLLVREILDTYLKENPESSEGYFLRSQAWLQEKDYLKCVDDLDRTLSFSKSMSPDLYFERASLLKKLGGEENLKRALLGLDAGIEKIGPFAIFQELAIDIALDLKNYPDALQRLDILLSVSARKEQLFARKSEILLQAGQEEEARLMKERALQAIANLPPEHRRTPIVVKLEETLKANKF